MIQVVNYKRYDTDKAEKIVVIRKPFRKEETIYKAEHGSYFIHIRTALDEKGWIDPFEDEAQAIEYLEHHNRWEEAAKISGKKIEDA